MKTTTSAEATRKSGVGVSIIRACLGLAFGMAVASAGAAPAAAHGPLFSPSPETIWKGGTELTLGLNVERASSVGEDEEEYEAYAEAEYGLTANWEIGVEVPYKRKDVNGRRADGLGDVTLHTKYQFWNRDLPGAQYKAAALFKTKLPTADDDSRPQLGSGSTDVVAGLATGYESRRWYWFASGLYRVNAEGAGGLENGDRQFLNAVAGVRPVRTAYDEPDTVLMLELNWENAGRDKRHGVALASTGGWELFVSPVLWWTYRQLAVRGGVQIPIAEGLNGRQATSDYRARVELVYHF